MRLKEGGDICLHKLIHIVAWQKYNIGKQLSANQKKRKKHKMRMLGPKGVIETKIISSPR